MTDNFEFETRLIVRLFEGVAGDVFIGDIVSEIGEKKCEAVFEKLRSMNYRIEAHGNYARLLSAREAYDEVIIRLMLRMFHCPRNVVLLENTQSTNLAAKEFAENHFCGVVAAKTQSGGKGRNGRTFSSPAGGLYFSLVMDVGDSEGASPLKYVIVAGVSTCLALEKLGFSPKLKWPNDVYIDGKKLVGILCETVTTDSGKKLIIGIGINVNTECFDPELADTATSLYLESGKRFSRAELLAGIVSNIENMNFGTALCEYRKRSMTIGHAVSVLAENGAYTAQAIDIDDEGFLMVETVGGVRRIVAGDVSIRPAQTDF